MKKNKLRLLIISAALPAFFNLACAQTQHQQNLKTLDEARQAAATTVLLNNARQQLIPLQSLETAKIVSVHFAWSQAAVFDSLLNKYSHVETIAGSAYTSPKNLNNLADDLKMFNTVLVELTADDLSNTQLVPFITTLQKVKNIVLILFGSGSNLQKLEQVTAPIIWSEKVTPASAMFCAQAIFGGQAITQKLPKTFSALYTAGSGAITEKNRLSYEVPEAAGINADDLEGIDKIAREAIRERATPGCVVLVAKDGRVIFNKAYGYHTYDNQSPDKVTDIFDLASVTKVAATNLENMRLYEQGKLGLDSTVGSYIATARNSNKRDLRIRDILEHQAGLVPDVATWERLKPADLSHDSSAAFPTKIVDHLFLRKNYFSDVTWPLMLASGLPSRGKYVYSDLSMYFMKEIDETITAIPLNVYVQQNFYAPLGMQTAGFLPLQRFPKDRIVPTEKDDAFRHTLLVGYVHDQGAGMLGGVSGHAGLFATTNDLAIYCQLLLNKGSYGGAQYFKSETVDLFTAKQSEVSRRALGFDMWDPRHDLHYPSALASPETYGHTGYTGTCFWVDPKLKLVYIFLSNRVNPNDGVNKLSGLNIRGRIEDAAIQAVQKGLQ